MNTIVIGHDYREQEAYDVCEFSIRRRNPDIRIVRLQERDLRATGLYTRPFKVDEAGQFWDERDGRPFSVAFSFARFLTPLVARAEGQSRGWALFIDCDFIAQRDPAELFALADPNKSVMVVKHNHEPKNIVKMDGVAQSRYPRKNWSSCILWNLDSEFNDALTARMVNTMPGAWLHGFKWLPDSQIGELPEEWNWLAGHSPTQENIDGKGFGFIHYTDGGPWFSHMQDCPLAERYLDEREAMRAAKRGLPIERREPAWAR